jgi:hypothetical protein
MTRGYAEVVAIDSVAIRIDDTGVDGLAGEGCRGEQDGGGKKKQLLHEYLLLPYDDLC